MALITLASSERCRHCRNFEPAWNEVIGNLPREFKSYFRKPDLKELQKEVSGIEAVPELIVRHKKLVARPPNTFLTRTKIDYGHAGGKAERNGRGRA